MPTAHVESSLLSVYEWALKSVDRASSKHKKGLFRNCCLIRVAKPAVSVSFWLRHTHTHTCRRDGRKDRQFRKSGSWKGGMAFLFCCRICARAKINLNFYEFSFFFFFRKSFNCHTSYFKLSRCFWSRPRFLRYRHFCQCCPSLFKEADLPRMACLPK